MNSNLVSTMQLAIKLNNDSRYSLGYHRSRIVVFFLVSFIINLLIFISGYNSHFPTIDEARTISAGLDYLRTGRLDVSNDIPPLARLFSVMPIAIMGQPAKAVTIGQDTSMITLPKFDGHDSKYFLPLPLVYRARIAGPFWWMLGAWLIFLMANELYGERAGWMAIILWGVVPQILAREQMATSDLPAAVVCFAATYVFHRWLRRPSWEMATLAGILLGFALLIDYCSTGLLVTWPVLAFISQHKMPKSVRIKNILISFINIIIVVILTINLGYGFSQTGLALKNFRFFSHALGGSEITEKPSGAKSGNSFSTFVIGNLIVPLPASYVTGFDWRLKDAEMRTLDTHGVNRSRLTDRGAFALSTLFARVPLGVWGLLGGSLVLILLNPSNSRSTFEELTAWISMALPPLIALSPLKFLFSMPVMLTLPIPLIIVCLCKLSVLIRVQKFKLGCLVSALVVWTAISSLASLPYPLYYLNEYFGGSYNVSSQIHHLQICDSGQELLKLKPNIDAHYGETFGIALDHILNTSHYGINDAIPPAISRNEIGDYREYTIIGGPVPGYFALDICNLRKSKYSYFKNMEPVYRAGPSLLVYHITSERNEQLRERSGLATDHDFLALKKWLNDHPEIKSLGLASELAPPQRLHECRITLPPAYPGQVLANKPWLTRRIGPYPGVYAIDLFNLQLPEYRYFTSFISKLRIGHSINVYQVTGKDAEDLRLRLAAPPIQPLSKVGHGLRGLIRKTWVDHNGDKYNYAIFLPNDYTGDRLYPLVLFLHGYGDRQSVEEKYLKVGLPHAIEAMQDTFGYITIFPEGHSGMWPSEGDDARVAMDILASAEQNYKVDSKRIYLTGVSSGAEGVWNLAAKYPDRWAAIIPVASSSSNPRSASAIKKIPCWCFHNSYDQSSPPRIPRAMIAALQEAGGSPKYTEFFRMASDNPSATSHNAWDKAYSITELYEWMNENTAK